MAGRIIIINPISAGSCRRDNLPPHFYFSLTFPAGRLRSLKLHAAASQLAVVADESSAFSLSGLISFSYGGSKRSYGGSKPSFGGSK
ncbi:hypothetical protein [uncultured Alloprevotella sp.]|uniref:hypothetical protein n=1 Tax=uncultured Alloprevotella sp. TaxID=1283315 RepID=UPI00261507AA|nr:hypothetical protein [uncultured Alloprevotella sp.]